MLLQGDDKLFLEGQERKSWPGKEHVSLSLAFPTCEGDSTVTAGCAVKAVAGTGCQCENTTP